MTKTYQNLYKYKKIESSLEEIEIKKQAKKRTDLDMVFEMIETNKVWYSNSLALNDPFEFQCVPVTKNPHLAAVAKLELNSKFGIFSMSPILDNPVLWSLYCNRYRGVVLKILPKSLKNLHNVEYAKSAYMVPPKTTLNATTEIYKILSRKSTYWSYEQEVRSILPQQGLVELECDEGIQEVIMGFYLDNEVKEIIREKIGELNIKRTSKISLKVLNPSISSYELVADDYNPNKLYCRYG